MSSEPLVCPTCGRRHSGDERFCPDCSVPLVYESSLGPDIEVSAAQARARKVKPQYAEGDLVRVAGARHQAEGEFIQGLLLEEGIPSLLRRSAGFDVPDFLAAGPRDVMVPASGAAAAREVLLEAEIASGEPRSTPMAAPWRLLAILLIAVAVLGLVAWIVVAVGR